jgi:hypothetical protein
MDADIHRQANQLEQRIRILQRERQRWNGAIDPPLQFVDGEASMGDLIPHAAWQDLRRATIANIGGLIADVEAQLRNL